MGKIDLKKDLKQYYNPSKKNPSIVNVPDFQFLMINGEDAREDSPGFQEAIQVLFSVSYKVKFQIKKSQQTDYAVMPLEGLWWANNMEDFVKGNKKNWKWTLMIMQPGFVTQSDIDEAIEIVSKKNNLKSLGNLRLEKFKEGLSVQIMHIGPYSEEYENIMKVHNYIHQNGGQFDGQVQRHHEIYLSDFRRTAPDKLKTVLRQPFVNTGS